MKRKLTTILLLLFAVALTTHAQKVKEKDILGTWKMVIDIDKELDEEAEEADTYLEEIIIKSVSGVVNGIVGNIDIYFDFRKNNELFIEVDAFGQTETEQAEWVINKKGYLEIDGWNEDGDDNHFQFSSDNEEWKLVDGVLVSDDQEEDKNVYLTRVD
ncbi:MAG: hypothetical protein AAGA66_08730 [Bacteroidota bacterium]